MPSRDRTSTWRLYNPQGHKVFDQSFTDVDVLTLAVPGTYTLLVEGYYYADGVRDYQFNVQPLSAVAQFPDLVVSGLDASLLGSDLPLALGGFDLARGGSNSLADGTQAAAIRGSITSAYPAATFTSTATLTAEYLASIDVLVLWSASDATTGITPLSAAEQSALRAFVEMGGTAILLVDNDQFAGGGSDAINESLLDPFGIDVTGQVAASESTADVIDPAASLLTAGPAGTIGQYATSFPGWFDQLGPFAASIARLQANNQPVLAQIDPGRLAPGSGRVVLSSDGDLPTAVLLNALAIVTPAHSLSVDWTTANSGAEEAAAPWNEHIVVRNLTTGRVVSDTSRTVATSLGPGESTPGNTTVRLRQPGHYRVELTTDATDQVVEYAAAGDTGGEQNNVRQQDVVRRGSRSRDHASGRSLGPGRRQPGRR